MSSEGQKEDWREKEEAGQRETPAGTEIQEERLGDINVDWKWKAESIIILYFLWEENFQVIGGNEVEARRSSKYEVGKTGLGFWKFFLLKWEKQIWLS